MVLQLVAFTCYLLVTVMIVSVAVLYTDLPVYVALPLVIFLSPMIAVYMIYRCSDEL